MVSKSKRQYVCVAASSPFPPGGRKTAKIIQTYMATLSHLFIYLGNGPSSWQSTSEYPTCLQYLHYTFKSASAHPGPYTSISRPTVQLPIYLNNVPRRARDYRDSRRMSLLKGDLDSFPQGGTGKRIQKTHPPVLHPKSS